MDNIKNDQYHVNKLIEDLTFIVSHMCDVGMEEFSTNEVLQDSMIFRMIQLSENARKLTDEYKASRNAVPWNALYGLRNRIVHDYGNVDLHIVYDTLVEDIPELLRLIE